MQCFLDCTVHGWVVSETSAQVSFIYGVIVACSFSYERCSLLCRLLMKDGNLVATSKDAITVLQTMHRMPLAFVSERQHVGIMADNPNRHIISGVATVLGGLTPPYIRYNFDTSRQEESWIWGVGHHPFGAFSRTSSVSKLLLVSQHEWLVCHRYACNSAQAIYNLLADVVFVIYWVCCSW